MKRITLPIPPTVEEQERIVADVNDRLSGLDDAISRAESEINLIREYRTRLIADVVTGKLDVRSVEVPELEDSGPDDYVTEADDELVADEEVLAYADD